MSKELSTEELDILIKKCLDKLNAFQNELSSDEENKQNKKRAMLLAYWIIGYVLSLIHI